MKILVITLELANKQRGLMMEKDFVKLGDKNECLICNDNLNRSKHIKPLTTLLSNIGNEDSFVMTVSAPYGGGKTFFVKMWQNYLKNRMAIPYIIMHGKMISQ